MAMPTTTEELRSRLDRGRGGDKVDFPDPSAAPLGTDDEAAGTPPSESDVELAARHEVTRAPSARPNDTGERVRGIHDNGGIPNWVWILAATLVAVGAMLALLGR
jgi:hypothetical protein